MKALIIGGAGFVGGYLMRYLRDIAGQEIAVTKMPGETIVETGVAVYDLNVLEPQAVSGLLQEVQPDYIYHLAALSSVALSWKNPSLTIDINVKGSVHVLDAVRGMEKKPRVLLIGSGEEYGHVLENEIPILETNLLRPGNIYAATKACQNMLGSIYAEAYQMDVMMVRAFNHIGPTQLPAFVVSDFCKQVAEIEMGRRTPIMRVGNLSARRDFTDVRDVVRAYALLMEHGAPGETYNVGRGSAIAIEELLHMILAESTAEIEVETDPAKLRPVDVPIIEADTSKLTACTGWQPEIALEETIHETLEYWRQTI